MWNKIKIIFGLIFIGGIMVASTNDERIVADAKKYGVFDWIADCYAKGGINEQVAERGTIDVYLNGIQSFDDGKDHYATGNRHQANNEYYANNTNGVGEERERDINNDDDWQEIEYLEASHARYVDDPSFQMPELLRKILIGLLVVYLGNFAIASMRGEEAESE